MFEQATPVTIRTLEIVNQKIPADYRLCLGVEIGDDCHFLAVVDEYDLNERVNALLTEMGYDIEKLSGYLAPYPCEPIAPQSDRFDTEEEYAEAVKAYEGKVEAHREKCAELTAKAEAGEMRAGRNISSCPRPARI